MRRRWGHGTRHIGLVLLCFGLSLSYHAQAGADEPAVVPDFAEQIQPILAGHCYQCHAAGNREGGLRLDHKGSFQQGGDSGPVIAADSPATSELLRRITAEDESERMPPTYDEDVPPLSAEQITLLEAWVTAGAPWPEDLAGTDAITSDHWSYQPIVRPELPSFSPEVLPEGWPSSGIDHFVLQRLVEHGIAPSPAARPQLLVKRLYYDLLGLPPDANEVAAFLADPSDEAYEALVDRLLASPHFGERWGRHWLDMARYADSDGYEKDNARPNAWRYRDWVIQAINNDMPLDEFTIQQLAGDLLENAGPMEQLATAFHRQTLTNTEGGTDQEEFRVAATIDRVNTTSTVWLGLTVGCAQCHTHKYDQITQQEYYQLFAFFNNGDEAETRVPISDAAVEDYEQQQAAHQERVAAHQAKITAYRNDLTVTADSWEATLRQRLDTSDTASLQAHPVSVAEVKSQFGVTYEPQADGSYLASGKNPETETLTIHLQADLPQITGFRIEALADESLPSQGPGRIDHGNFVLNEVHVSAASSDTFAATDFVPLAAAVASHQQKGWPAAHAIDGDAKTGWAIAPQTGQDQQLTVYFAEPLNTASRPHLQVVLSQEYGRKHTLGRFRITALSGYDETGGLPAEILAALQTPTAERTEQQTEQLLDFRLTTDISGHQLLEAARQLASEAPAEPLMNVAIIRQRTKEPRATHLLRRGDFLQPQHEVQPGVLSVLHPLASRHEEGPPDRLDLARWLVDPANPLTPRVTANHIWARLFGRGLVETVDDFGVQGEPPSHPELLDWLAISLLDENWSRKAFIKQVVTSATYRQASNHRPELADVDPLNKLLYRQNRFRMEGEAIRDLSLSVSGLLSAKVGGPSVFPPMPDDVAKLSYANNFSWKASEGEDRYRRGMYTFFKRTAPHPNLITFDCPDSSITSVTRQVSNTPLQALTTLNNDTFVEAAQAFGRRLLTSADDDTERLTTGFQLCTARPPTAVELQRLAELLDAARDYYLATPEAASELVGSYHAEAVSAEETAAWVATARVLLNLDEFLTRE